MISDITKLVIELKPMIELLTLIAVGITAWMGVRNSNKLKEVHDLTNSMSDKLQVQAKEIGRQEGKETERTDNIAVTVKAAEMVAATHQDAADTQVKAAETQLKAATIEEVKVSTKVKK